MTSVDLTSRLMVYKPTPCNKTTVNLLLFTDNRQSSFILRTILRRAGQCLGLTDTLRLAFRNFCAKLVVQQFKVLQLWQICKKIHPSSTKMNENQRPL